MNYRHDLIVSHLKIAWPSSLHLCFNSLRFPVRARDSVLPTSNAFVQAEVVLLKQSQTEVSQSCDNKLTQSQERERNPIGPQRGERAGGHRMDTKQTQSLMKFSIAPRILGNPLLTGKTKTVEKRRGLHSHFISEFNLC